MKLPTEKPLSLTHIWVMTKYRGRGMTVEQIINDDITYVTWCLNKRHLFLDKIAQAYYQKKVNK